MKRNLVLIGFMGTGKTRVGRLCAKELGFEFCDSDKAIEDQVGCSVAQMFAEQGEATFRAKEREVIAELAATSGLVIATGGGAVLNPENVANLRRTGTVVLLTASPAVILRRVGNAQTRPLLAEAADPRARVMAMLRARQPYYERAAQGRVDTTRKLPQEVAEEVLKVYSDFQQEP